MFGGDGTNHLLPIAMDSVRLPYDANAVPSMQLDVIMNMVGEKSASLANLPVKRARAMPVFNQPKHPVSSMLKQIPVSTGLRLSYGEEEPKSSVSSAGENTIGLPHRDNLKTELVRQNDELDQYIRIQEENLRKGLKELKQRHTFSLLNALETEVSSKLHEKDIEIENLNRKNKELSEKIKQIAVEAQSWHLRAKQNESLVNALRSNINEVLLQGAAYLKEGCGENMVDDAVSSSNQNSHNHSLADLEKVNCCKACRSKGISVLLLPCRHLCVCIECGAFVDSCPVCQVQKTGILQVYMS